MIYLDHNATTPVAPPVLEAMLPAFGEVFANPASSHPLAAQARRLVDGVRERLAEAGGVGPAGVVFTSGSTEALNLVLRGIKPAAARRRILVGATEHKAVLEAAASRSDLDVEILPVRADGRIDHDTLARRLAGDVLLVAIMAANNETGVVNDIDSIADLVHDHGALLLADTTQVLGKLPLGVFAAADFRCVSAHKAYGPKGVGALLADRAALTRLAPQIVGGGHERGYRSGTVNVPGIVGLGACVALAEEQLPAESERLTRLRDRLEVALAATISGVELVGDRVHRLCNTVNLRFAGADAEAIMANMPEVAVSSGSACQSAVPSPSHVLVAMGMSPAEAGECIRFSLGATTTEDEINEAARQVRAAVERVRAFDGEEATA